MPMIDMPLAELKDYMGLSPRPSDFDAYWDAALEEMRAVDPQVELAPAEFQCDIADCYDMTFTGVGGARVYAKLLKPKHLATQASGLVEFHGYSGNSGNWFEKLPYASAGFVVASMDCRGQGGRSEDVGGVVGNTLRGHIIRGLDGKPEDLLFRQIFLDTAQLAGLVMDMDEVDETRVAAKGGSQGGALTVACAALEPRIARATPMFPFLSDYRRVWEMDQDQNAYAELRDYFRRFDPQHKREEAIFQRLGYIDIQNLAPRIKGDILWFTGLMDNVCPPSTQFAAYNKITATKTMEIFPDFGHEGLPGAEDIIFNYLCKM